METESVDERTVNHESDELPSPPSGPDASVATLGRQLAALELVDVTTFDGVCQTVGATDSGRVVTQLEQSGKLTPFQAQLIRQGSAEGLRFDEYVLVDKLGEGGMGTVYKACNLMLGRVEAIKTIVNLEGAESALLKRFEQEARVLARLEHPAIVPIYKVGNFQGTKYIAMKYVEGDDLRQKVKEAKSSGRPIPVATACRWIVDAAEALAYAHKQNVIHRDIKPGNLIITRSDQRLIVLDMGIARLADPQTQQQGAGLTGHSGALGTPEFMPPEQWADARNVTPAADIYALGVTLFYLLAGKVPFQSTRMVDLMRAHATEPVPLLSALRSDVPPEIDSIIAHAMAKRPEDRYHDAAELADALRVYTESLPSRQQTPVSIPRIDATQIAATVVEKRPSRAPLFVAGIAFVAVVAAASGWFLWSRTPEQTKGPASVAVIEEPPLATAAAPAWLMEFQKEHAEDWPDLAELVAKTRELTGDQSLDDSPGSRSALEKETSLRMRRRFRGEVEAWMAEHQQEHPAAWPSVDAMKAAAGGLAVLNRIESSSEIDAIKDQLLARTARLEHPFEDMNPGELTSDWIRDAKVALSNVLGLFAHPADPNWRFDAEFIDENHQPVRTVKPGQAVHARCTSSRDAYVTIVMFDPWMFSVMPVEAQATAYDTLLVDENFRFSEPGRKRFYLVATPERLFTSALPPIFTNDERPIQHLFSDELIYERILESLTNGQPMPGVRKNPDIRSWALKVIELEVVK